MFRSGHRYVQVFVSGYPISACIDVSLTEETLDEAEVSPYATAVAVRVREELYRISSEEYDLRTQ